MEKQKGKQKGFTLMEVMVVVVIIGILTSAGLFVYSSALKNSKIDKTVQMIRTIQADLEIYLFERGMLDNSEEPTHIVVENFINDFNKNYSSMRFATASFETSGNSFTVYTEINTDAWGNKLAIYYSFDNNICIVASAGGNGKMDFLTERDSSVVDDIMAVMRRK